MWIIDCKNAQSNKNNGLKNKAKCYTLISEGDAIMFSKNDKHEMDRRKDNYIEPFKRIDINRDLDL